MQVKRFVAADMRRALELVRQQLGPDAIILSSGRNENGVELMVTMGSDIELMQLQQQPMGKIAMNALPMISDGAWSETAISERAAAQVAAAPNISVAPSVAPLAHVSASKMGKTGQQLAEEIERARQRMLANNKLEESAKEFLVDKNTRVNAGIPRYVNAEAKAAAGARAARAAKMAVTERQEPRFSAEVSEDSRSSEETARTGLAMKEKARYALEVNKEARQAHSAEQNVRPAEIVPESASLTSEPQVTLSQPARQRLTSGADNSEKNRPAKESSLRTESRQVSVPSRRTPVPRPVVADKKPAVVEKPKSAMTAAERYPLIDSEPVVESVTQSAPVASAAPVLPAAAVQLSNQLASQPEKLQPLVRAPAKSASTDASARYKSYLSGLNISEPVANRESPEITQPVAEAIVADLANELMAAPQVVAAVVEDIKPEVKLNLVVTADAAVPVEEVTASVVKEPLPITLTEAVKLPQESSREHLQELQSELANMRFLLEQQIDRMSEAQAPAASSSPVLDGISRRLERVGLPEDVIGKVIGRCSKIQSVSEAWPEALAHLTHQLPVIGRDIVDEGGVFAFVGPTGVGKTTTIGKLAARYVLKHGADKVALITTDTYRIAAHDQLRSIARILRVPVRVVDEINTLEVLLRNLSHCPLILIDTAGFRHGDPQLKAQLASLAEQPQVKTFMVLSSNSQEQMMKASVHAYGAARLHGCVLTKLDETASLGEALGVAIRSWLPVAYTTDGQDIPQNIEVAQARNMVAKAVSLTKKSTESAVS
ncbi:MAG TPA: flagellar biosynthesis protein FlhF [Cellvibrio sp.]|nr:flagellar biosynthesis protein FlhF [Cellvibrio sp.]